MAIDILIDSDPGMGLGSDIDDNLAILWALVEKRVRVQGITLTYGNVRLEEAYLSLSKTLRLINKPEIPFALGNEQPLSMSYQSAKERIIHIAKSKGVPLVLDNTPLRDTELLPAAPSSAVEFLLSAVEKHPGLRILALGPLTNIATAIKTAPKKMSSVNRIVVMGGSINEAGNVSPVSEFNISCDPEAAEIVFSSGLPITLVGLDVTHKVKISLQEVMGIVPSENGHRSELSSFVLESTRKWIEVCETVFGNDFFNPHDAIAFAYLLYPELFHVKKMYLQVETCGVHTLGQVIGIPIEHLKRYPMLELKNMEPAEVCIGIDDQRFKVLFLNYLQALLTSERR